MCGRITQDLNLEKLFEIYRLSPAAAALNLAPRYNGCPTQDFVVCRKAGGERRLAKLRWGLVPAWSKDLGMGARMINARAETVHEKPAFRTALRHRRCVVPVNGWFEWRREDGEKQPYFIRPAGGGVISLAGLWERWEKGSEPVETFTVLTTGASPALADVHHRQPAIVEPDDLDGWLEPATAPVRLLEIAGTSSPGPFEHWAVGREVNHARNDSPELLHPIGNGGRA